MDVDVTGGMGKEREDRIERVELRHIRYQV